MKDLLLKQKSAYEVVRSRNSAGPLETKSKTFVRLVNNLGAEILRKGTSLLKNRIKTNTPQAEDKTYFFFFFFFKKAKNALIQPVNPDTSEYKGSPDTHQ